MRTTIVGLMLAMVAPAVAYADGVRNFNNYCTTGALRTCASVSVSVVTVGSTTTLSITVQNLQGTHPADNSGSSLFGALSLGFLGIPTDPAWDPDALTKSIDPGNAQVVGSGPVNWDAFVDNNAVLILLTPIGGGITGCNPAPLPMNFPSLGDVTAAYQTCPGQGSGGPVTFSFSTDQSTQWDVNNIDLDWTFEWTQATGGGITCRPGINCAQVTVVPEPVTMVLRGPDWPVSPEFAGPAGERKKRPIDPISRGGWQHRSRGGHVVEAFSLKAHTFREFSMKSTLTFVLLLTIGHTASGLAQNAPVPFPSAWTNPFEIAATSPRSRSLSSRHYPTIAKKRDHTVAGVLIGAGLGFAAGWALYNGLCVAANNSCTDSRVRLLMIGGVVGGSIGGLIGSVSN